MQIQPISNNQQTFNGYVQHKLKKNIRKNLLKSGKCLEDCKIDLRKEKYQVLLEQGKRTLEKLEKFVAPLHKDTSIGIHKDSGYLLLSNPIATGKTYSYPWAEGIIIHDEICGNKAWWSLDNDAIHVDVYTGIDKHLVSRDLEKIELVIDTINKCIKPEEIDEAFLRMAEEDLRQYSSNKLTGKSSINKFLINKVVKRIEKYAKSIGKTTDARKIAEERLQELEEMANKQKTENKTKSGMIQPSKKKKTPEDKQLAEQFISEVRNLC